MNGGREGKTEGERIAKIRIIKIKNEKHKFYKSLKKKLNVK